MNPAETSRLTLSDFLLARIAEDEETAQTDLGDPSWGWSSDFDGGEVVRVFTPPRVLAECEAKRRIVEMHGSDDPQWEGDCPWCGVHGPCLTIRALALPYADHPDFREEWRA